MNMDYIIDDMFFILSSIVVTLYIFIKNPQLNYKTKIVSSILLIVLNSSYNSHFTVINDNNDTTLRTFIWSYKLIYKFSLIDILCIIYILLYFYKIPRILRRRPLLRKIFVVDITLYLISFVSLIITKSYQVDSLSHFIIFSKSLVYSLAFMIVFDRHLNNSFDFVKPLIIIMVFSAISMLLHDASLIKSRYGNPTLLSDQEDITLGLYYLTLYFSIYILMFLKSNKKIMCSSKTILVLFTIAFVYYMFFRTMSKGALLFVAIDIMLFLFIFRKQYTSIILVSLFMCLLIFITYKNKIFSLLYSDAMFTRFYQLFDYMAYIKDGKTIALLIGIGLGGAYFSRGLGDSGEVKGIDLLKYGSNWKFEIQTPILTVFKDSGILGITIFLINRFYILIYVIKNYIKKINIRMFSTKNVESMTNYLYLTTLLFSQYIFHTSVGPIAIFMMFIVQRIENDNLKRRV